MSKTIPRFATDEEAERFVETTDLSDYDLSGFRPVRFAFQRTEQAEVRLPRATLDAAKAEAERRGMPYERFIELAIEQALAAKP